MVGIIILVGCCAGIADMAAKKGRSRAGYVILFLALWFGVQFLGAYIAVLAGARDHNVVLLAAVLGTFTGAGTGFLIVAMLPNIKPQIDYSNRRYGYAPNLPNSDAPYDPANPYAAPQRNNPTDLPPVVLDPNDVMGWLDQQQRKS